MMTVVIVLLSSSSSSSWSSWAPPAEAHSLCGDGRGASLV